MKGDKPGGKQQEGNVTEKLNRAQAISAIRADYDANYFVSGRGDMAAYAPDCLFADPFAGFNGVTRFKNNVSNLGSLMEDISLEIMDWREEESQLVVKWRFSAVLRLPWRPVLAAAGGTTHVFDEASGCVVKHIESWDVQPGKVVRNLLRPSRRVPSNQWEVLFGALYEGDVAGIWFALSASVLKAALAVGAVDLAVHAATGSGLQAVTESVIAAAAAAAAVTQVVKFAQGMQGGDTGTGGRF